MKKPTFLDDKISNVVRKLFVRMPSCRDGVRQIRSISKMNRFLESQERRAKKLLEKKQYDKIFLLWMVMLKNSKSYQIALFNIVTRDWYYKWTQKEAREKLEEFMNKCRVWDWRSYIDRFYIEKKNGELRPIGSPKIATKIMGKAMADVITFALDETRPCNQHGYRPNKGSYSALNEVRMKLLKRTKETLIFEFDFKSFFNSVKYIWIKRYLSRYSELFANLVYDHLLLIWIKGPFKEEKEVKVIGKKANKEVRVREGIPQGLPQSPILATLAAEYSGIPSEVTMYADDGIYIGEDFEYFEYWLDKLDNAGAALEMQKSRMVSKEFNFLGVEFNLENDTMSYNGSVCGLSDLNAEHWCKQVMNKYGKPASGWSWVIKKDSYLDNLSISVPIIQKIKVLWYSLWHAKSYKGIRYFIDYGFVDVIHSSTNATELLLSNINLLKLTKVKSLFIPDLSQYENYFKDKGQYYEILPEMRKINILSNASEYEKITDNQYFFLG